MVPLMIVSDNGTEATSLAIPRWTQGRPVEWHHIAPGKPQQRGLPVSLSRSLASDPNRGAVTIDSRACAEAIGRQPESMSPHSICMRRAQPDP